MINLSSVKIRILISRSSFKANKIAHIDSVYKSNNNKLWNCVPNRGFSASSHNKLKLKLVVRCSKSVDKKN